MTHKTQCLASFVNVIDRLGPDQQKLCDWGDITHVTHYTLHIAHYTLHVTHYTLRVNIIDIMAAPADRSPIPD